MQAVYIHPWEEHQFWLEILQDHAIFVRDHLSVEERSHLEVAQQYIDAFAQLRSYLNRIEPSTAVSNPVLMEFATQAWQIANGYYQFEGMMQHLRIQNKINLNLSPTYLNGTLHENQEYLRILSYYQRGQDYPPLPLVDLLDLWMEDQLGHAVLLRNILDPIELSITREIDGYISRFQSFIVQNHHIRSYLRFTPPGMPRQNRLALQVGEVTIAMNQLIEQVVQLYQNEEVLSRTTLRFLEHHFPESCYFLKKLSLYAPEIAGVAGQCVLTKPSFT